MLTVRRDCDYVVWLYHPTRYIYLSATPLFLLAAVAIGLEYNAAHSSIAAAVVVGRHRQ